MDENRGQATPSNRFIIVLARPSVLLAIGLLLLNDHCLKAHYPGVLTGKISDLAGLFFFPLLIAAFLGPLLARPCWRGRRLSADPVMMVALALAGGWFVALKATTPSNAWAVGWLNRLTGQSNLVVADPSDLVALAVLPLTWHTWRRTAVPPPRRRLDRRGLAALGVASLAVLATSPIEHLSAAKVIPDPHTSGRVYAFLVGVWQTEADHGPYQLFLSNDDGDTWDNPRQTDGRFQAQGSYQTSSAVIAFDPSTPGVVYLGGTNGLQKSTDDGDTWMPLLPGVPISRVHDIAVAPTDPNRVFVVAQPTPDLRAESIVVGSSDGGLTADWVADRPSARLNTITIHPTDADTIFVAGDGVFRSTDNGETWQELAAPARISGATGIAASFLKPNTIYITAKGDIWRSDDGGATWQIDKHRSVDEPGETAFYAWDVAASSRPPYRVYVAAGERGIETWTPSRMLFFDTGRWRTTSKGLRVADEGWITPGNMLEDIFAAFFRPVTVLTLMALIAGHAYFLWRSGQGGGVDLSAYRASRTSLILVTAGLVAFLLPAVVVVPMFVGGLLTAVDEFMVLFATISLVVVSLLANSIYRREPSRRGKRNRTAAVLFALLATLTFLATLGEAVRYYVL